MGFMVLDHWTGTHKITTRRFGLKSRWGRGTLDGQEVVVLRPRTYMNLSGEAVSSAAKKFKMDTSRIVVVHDDLDIPLGRIKIAKKGGAGGHKGIQSIINALNTKDFIRVRVGIGRSSNDEDTVDWVLNPFCKQEIALRDQSIENGSAVIDVILREGADMAMNQFHQGR